MKPIALPLAAALWTAFAGSAEAATKRYCDCDAGAAVGCVAGNDSTGDGSVLTPYKTFSKYITDWKAGTHGDQFLHCQGGSWHSASQTVVGGGNLNNANATAADPIITDSYDATAAWVGGSGIAPLWTQAGSTVVLDFNQGTINSARNGYTFKNISIQGAGTNAFFLTRVDGSHNYITFDGMTFNAAGGGIQCNGGPTSPPAGGDALAVSQHLTIVRSTVSNMTGIGILSSCNDTRIEDSAFNLNGTQVTDHHIYIGGQNKAKAVPAVASIVGDGTTVTVTTSAPNSIWSGVPTTTQTAATITGAGYNITAFTPGSAITYQSPTTFTYSQTGVGTCSGCSLTAVRQVVKGTQIMVRGNTLTNANHVLGSCNESALLNHGEWENFTAENNLFREDTIPTGASCVAIEFDDGGYEPPEKDNAMRSIVVRNNTAINYATGYAIDLTENVLVENNYEYSAYAGGGIGINLRAKNYTPAAAYSGTATSGSATTLVDSGKTFSGLTANLSIVKVTGGTGSGQRRLISNASGSTLTVTPAWAVTPDVTSTYAVTAQSGVPINALDPNAVTIRYNTSYRTVPTLNTIGMALNGNVTDNLSGLGHNLYGNVTVLGSTATTATQCFNIANLTTSMFGVKDYNSCIYLGASVPKFNGTSSLSTVQGATCPASTVNDCNSSITANTLNNVTTDQPFFTSPTASPAVGASSALIGAGHPTLKPYSGWGGFKRGGVPTDRGAFGRGDATVIPNSPTRISVQ
jgi:hypothetical protein